MILHRILFGCLPWTSPSSEIFLEKISNQPLKLPLEINSISKETQSFLLSMLNPDVTQRANYNQIFEHKVLLQM
jgi:serine/threonine protein kinase